MTSSAQSFESRLTFELAAAVTATVLVESTDNLNR